MRFLTLLLVLWMATASISSSYQLEEGFASPPPSARPWVYWFWMNGNITREGITADLEAMKKAGIGGALIMEVGNTKHQRSQMAPPGPIAFGSPEWRKLFAHTLAEAGRLDLEISMNNDAGWCGSGGPWNPPELSMQKLAWSDTAVEGPRQAVISLPQPKSKRGPYRDIAVLAFPPAATPAAPVAPEQILDLTAHLDSSSRFQWDAPPGHWIVRRIGHTATGRMNHPAPAAGLGLECDKFSAAATRNHFEGFITKLADEAGPRAGKAFAMTHIDSWEVGEQDWTPRMADEFRQRRGYELTPWLVPLTEGPVVGSPELTARFRRDFKRTQAELLCENYGGTLRKLANSRGLRLSIEAYGPDGGFLNPLDYGTEADLPMAEFWVRRWDAWHLMAPRLLASAAHATGEPIVGAESFTAAPQAGNWNDHPYTLKALGDWAFCEGINRLVMHRMVLQPWADFEPGMTFGPFGTHFDRNQTWWEPGAAFLTYLARCQYLLQQGQFVADVCRLVPDGENYGSRSTMPKLPGRYPSIPSGYNFDFLSDKSLNRNVTVVNHRIVLPSGMSYRLMQLPESDEMTPELLRRIRELVTAGATVIGPRPKRSPSLQDYPRCDEAVRSLASELWGECDGKTVTEHSVGAGTIIWGKPLDTVLREAVGAPDLAFTLTPSVTPAALSPLPPRRRSAEKEESSNTMPTAGLNWIHRKAAETDIFFLANPQHRTVDALCTFRATGRRPEFWDPETGRLLRPATFVDTADASRVALHFSPAGSMFVVFREPVDPNQQVVAIQRDGAPLFSRDCTVPVALPELWWEGKGVQLQRATPGRYEIRLADGQNRTAVVSAGLPPLSISGPWKLQFQPKRGAPNTADFAELTDWSKHPNEGIRYFSGTATYTTTFDAPGEVAPTRTRSDLDLGRVEVMADVSLNGKALGVLWKPPFVLDVSPALRPGRNELSVRVTNLWANRLIGDERYPDDCTPDKSWTTGSLPSWPEWFLHNQPRPESRRVTFTTWKYYATGTPLLPSGLLGPVTLRSEEIVRVKGL